MKECLRVYALVLNRPEFDFRLCHFLAVEL